MEAAEPILRRQGKQLAGKHGAFVAFLDGELKAHATDADGLTSELRRLGLDAESLYVTFLPPSDAVFAYVGHA